MRTLATAGCLIAMLAAVAADAVAAPRGWIHLGSRTVTDRVDHDVIVVENGSRELTALRISVTKRAVEFRRATVHFANGSTQEIELRQVVPAGGSSQVVDLLGESRIVTRVELWYDAQSLGGKAVVRVFGRR